MRGACGGSLPRRGTERVSGGDGVDRVDQRLRFVYVARARRPTGQGAQKVEGRRICELRSEVAQRDSHVRHHLQDLLLHIISLEEPMRSTCQKTSHAVEEEHAQETVEQPSTWRKCHNIFTLVTRRLWTKESLCQDFQNSSYLLGMPHLE